MVWLKGGDSTSGDLCCTDNLDVLNALNVSFTVFSFCCIWLFLVLLYWKRRGAQSDVPTDLLFILPVRCFVFLLLITWKVALCLIICVSSCHQATLLSMCYYFTHQSMLQIRPMSFWISLHFPINCPKDACELARGRLTILIQAYAVHHRPVLAFLNLKNMPRLLSY